MQSITLAVENLKIPNTGLKHGDSSRQISLICLVENLKIPNTGLKHITKILKPIAKLVENLKIPNTGLKH